MDRTQTDKEVYQWLCIASIKKIMDRCFEIAYSPPNDACIKEDRVAALHLAFESYLQIAGMVKDMKIQYHREIDSDAADIDTDNIDNKNESYV